MPLYEHVYIARQDISPQQVEALTEQFSQVIAAGGGKVEKTEYWGLKNFAFRMKRYRKGHYVLMNVTAPPAAVLELERQQRIHDDVLRVLTIRVEEHETEPSAMMQSRGRDDRGERGDRGDRGDRPRRDRGERGFGGDRGGFGGDRGGFGGDRPRPRRDEGPGRED